MTVPYARSNAPCGRPRKTDQQPCELWRATYVWGGLVAPACVHHLTDQERTDWEAFKAARTAERRAKDEAEEPACWSWPTHESVRLALASPDQKTREDAFFDWHQGRCAVCGGNMRGDLVEDHCYNSGMTRGYLCRGCNISEGSSPAPVFRKYREYPPAFIVNHCREYRSPFGLPAVRAPRASREELAAVANVLSNLFHDDD